MRRFFNQNLYRQPAKWQDTLPSSYVVWAWLCQCCAEADKRLLRRAVNVDWLLFPK
jgi:hypothetical protein